MICVGRELALEKISDTNGVCMGVWFEFFSLLGIEPVSKEMLGLAF